MVELIQEKIILKGLVKDKAYFDKVLPYLYPDLFSERHTRKIFECLKEYHNRYGKQATPQVLDMFASTVKKISEDEYRQMLRFLDWYGVECVESEFEKLNETTQAVFLLGGFQGEEEDYFQLECFNVPPYPEDIPSDWPYELPIPDGVRILSAGYAEDGSYIVDIADEDWTEDAARAYRSDKAREYGFCLRITPEDSAEEKAYFNARYHYYGKKSILQMQRYEGCVSELILKP